MAKMEAVIVVIAFSVGCAHGVARLIYRDQHGGVVELGSGRDDGDRAAAARLMDTECPGGSEIVSEGEEVVGARAVAVGTQVRVARVRDETAWRIRYRCNAAAPEPETEARATPLTAARWWCTVIPGPGDLGSCSDTLRDCESTRVDFVRSEPGASSCMPRATAACFRRVDPALGEVESCSTNIAACRAYRDFVIAHPEELGTVSTECRVLD